MKNTDFIIRRDHKSTSDINYYRFSYLISVYPQAGFENIVFPALLLL